MNKRETSWCVTNVDTGSAEIVEREKTRTSSHSDIPTNKTARETAAG